MFFCVRICSTKGRNIMENKNEIIKGLFDIKASLSSEIFELENKLYLLRSSLKDINNEICRVGGHSFGKWKQAINPDWINDENSNKVYCYRRVCSICGKKEITFDINDTKVRSKKK